MPYKSIAQLTAYYNEITAMKNSLGKNYFAETPLLKAPYYEGKLTKDYLDYATKTLNFVRFLAGLPDDVSTTDELNTLSQKGALLLTKEYGHKPSRSSASDMSDELFNQGYKSTSSSNIAKGHASLYEATALGWAADGNENNLAAVGHRRWMLNPKMLYTGFGDVNKHYSMYAFDKSRKETVDYYAIGYPAGAAFPSELFRKNYPWSITVNTRYFETPDINTVKVTIEGDGKTYTLSNKNKALDGDYFNIEYSNYGIPNCIIFRPNKSTPYSGAYKVTITGLKLVNGEETSLTYTVNFFSVEGKQTEEKIEGSTGNPIEMDPKEQQKQEQKQGIEILSYPSKKSYIVGEGFNTTDVNVVNYTDGKATNISSKVSFYTSNTVQLTQGRAFTTAGKKVVELRYNNKKIGEYTINVTEKTEPEKTDAKHPFKDVSKGSYYENAVVWTYENGITGGTSETTFSPNDTCTRGQVVTFLWRASGKPEPATNKNPFIDVKSSDYYYKAVLWAAEKGITGGTSANTFSPNDTCISGQIVTFLWRANGKPASKGSSSLASKYSGEYYTDAIAWAESTGLLSGTGISFDPKNKSPRAEIVTYIYRNEENPASTENTENEVGGTYYIKASKDSKFIADVNGASKDNGAQIIIYTQHGGDNQKFKITKIGDNKYTIQSVHSGKYWKSSGTKGAVITQASFEKNNNAFVFNIIKQANGTYRIMDYKGFYLGIASAKMADGTIIILWTEAGDESQAYIFEKIN